jgi:TonB family protein
MNTHLSCAALALSALALSAVAGESRANAVGCATPIAGLRIDFPDRAQERRWHGTVRVAIQLNADGHVTAATLAKSSGHATLDRAARTSARTYWRFDVAKCTPIDLSRKHMVAITFNRSRGIGVSNTLNRRALSSQRQLLADRNCLATRPDRDTVVFACRTNSDVKAVEANVTGAELF